MNSETHFLDKKSLRVIKGNSADFKALAGDCVCLANAAGGRLVIGIEDGQSLPEPSQRVPVELIDKVRKRIGELTVNVQVAPEIVTAENGGEYLALSVARSSSVASTTDGRYFLRVGDTCCPVVGDDILRLLNERPGSPWESLTTLVVLVDAADKAKLENILQALRSSDRVKESVKEKTTDELLLHYGLKDGQLLTHLGVLLLCTAKDRARLGTAPLIQAIKYDAHGNKVNKWMWDDYTLSPIELIDAVWQQIPDFRESYELPDGLYRLKIPAYDERVVRELLVNALVHRPYTQRGDVFLNLYPDRLEIVNPGRLPLGVTPQNILHASRRRNERLATLFHDLRLMEKEGSGFDLMYDIQLSHGRHVPVPTEGEDWVKITVKRTILKPEAIKLIEDADSNYQLRQRERITLGLLAVNEGLTARELSEQLELPDSGELRESWLGRLLDIGLVQSSGKTQATRYFVNPDLLKGAGLDGQTTLRRIEPHRLRALIVEDLSRYPGSSSGEVCRRISPELAQKTIKRALDELINKGLVLFEGEKRGRRYWLADNGQNI